MVKKAHLVTGKGGVGKSLFSAALAHHFSTENQQILLTELNEHSFYKDFLNLPDISYTPSLFKSNLYVSQWSPENCLKEYSLHLLKIESLYKLFIENPVSKSLIQVAPGLQELSLLGKLTSSPRKHGPEMNFDQIVVDSHSTGHFLSLLRAPSALAEAVHFGPMGEQSREIDSWIRNKDFTNIHIVTIAEDLPITETIELYEQLMKEFGLKATVYLNRLLNLTEDDLSDLPVENKKIIEKTLQLEAQSKFKLKNKNIVFKEFPLITSLNTVELIEGISAYFSRSE